MENQIAFENDLQELVGYATALLKRSIYTTKNVEPIELISSALVGVTPDYIYERRSFQKEVRKACYQQLKYRRQVPIFFVERYGTNYKDKQINPANEDLTCLICKQVFPVSVFYYNKECGSYIRYCPDCKRVINRAYNKIRHLREKACLSDRLMISRLLNQKKYKGYSFKYFKDRPYLIAEYRSYLIAKNAKLASYKGTTCKERYNDRDKQDRANLNDRYIFQALYLGNKKYTAAYVRKHPQLIEKKRKSILAFRVKKSLLDNARK